MGHSIGRGSQPTPHRKCKLEPHHVVHLNASLFPSGLISTFPIPIYYFPFGLLLYIYITPPYHIALSDRGGLSRGGANRNSITRHRAPQKSLYSCSVHLPTFGREQIPIGGARHSPPKLIIPPYLAAPTALTPRSSASLRAALTADSHAFGAVRRLTSARSMPLSWAY